MDETPKIKLDESKGQTVLYDFAQQAQQNSVPGVHVTTHTLDGKHVNLFLTSYDAAKLCRGLRDCLEVLGEWPER